MRKRLTIIILLCVSVWTNYTEAQTFAEKIFLQTDKDICIAGENLFFKMHLQATTTQESKFAYLILRNEASTVVTGICAKLSDGSFSGSIYLPDTLKTGRYQLVSYTNCMRNDERSFTTREILIANRFDKDLQNIRSFIGEFDVVQTNLDSLRIRTEKTQFSRREKIRFVLENKGMNAAELSITIREKEPEIQIEKRSHSAVSPSTKYLTEIHDKLIQGRVLEKQTSRPIAGSVVFLSTPDTVANLQFTSTDSLGYFRFSANEYYNGKNVYIKLREPMDAIIELDNNYDINTPYTPGLKVSGNDLIKYILRSQDLVQIQKAYGIRSSQELPSENQVNKISYKVYGPVKNPVYPADFVKLTDFVEISREILPFLKIRKQKNSYHANITDINTLRYFEDSPMIFLDGVPLDDINQAIRLGTDQISKIETIPTERYFGDLYFPGILSIFSKTHEIENVGWSVPVLTSKPVLIHPSSSMKTPDYSVSRENLPDFRQVLYWNPDVKLTGNEITSLEAAASDNTGVFEILVRGITGDGTPVNISQTIRILPN